MKITEIIKTSTKPAQMEMSVGATGAGAIATAPSAGGGTLFGGSYESPSNPFKKRARKKKK